MKSLTLLKLAFITVALSACGDRSGHMDEELESYASTFELEASRHGVKAKAVNMMIVKQFSSDSIEGAVGVCYVSRRGRRIEILKSMWDAASDVRREALVMHEQGHCALGLKHSKGGIMKPTVLAVDVYKQYRAHFLAELFDTVKE
jgi:hypothetical protein